MQIDLGQRLLPEVPTKSFPRRHVIFVILVIAIAFGVIFRESFSRLFYIAEETAGIGVSQRQFEKTYQRLGIAVLPPALLSKDRTIVSLNRLSQEPCNHQAIYTLANAMVSYGEQRMAASTLMRFSATCPATENEQATAGQLFLNIDDSERALMIAGDLIAARPEVANYHYFRGKTLVASGHDLEAVNEYKSTIDLT